MAEPERLLKERAEPPPAGGGLPDPPGFTPEQFLGHFGEDLLRALDLGTWQTGRDLSREYPRILREVREAVEGETVAQRRLRAYVFDLLAERPGAPKNAGRHPADPDTLLAIPRGLLFNGGVEACDGTVHVLDTLPLTVYQMGVSLVSYRGDEFTWSQRLFRRDLRQEQPDMERYVDRLLERRAERAALNHDGSDDPYGPLLQRALMSWAERAVLADRSTAVWRMGHGNPIPYELLTGAGCLELMVAATRTLRRLIEYGKFVFVASEPRDRLLLTIGQALHPLEYALVETLDERLGAWVRQGRFAAGVTSELDWDGEKLAAVEWIPRFIREVASQVAVGVYRASPLAPAHLFYAHMDHADLAAHIVLADSVLQEHRGFPLLIDIADHVCDSVFGGSLRALTEQAYAAAGEPWRYYSERSTRAR